MSLRRIRTWLVVGLVLPAALVFTPARAQFGRPPIPPGGIAGRPGGIGGMPGGINGGIAGRPGGIGGINGGIGGMPGGMGQHQWVCGGCGKVLGTGAVKPVMASCPFCGVRFTNGLDFEVSRPGGGPPIGGPPVAHPRWAQWAVPRAAPTSRRRSRPGPTPRRPLPAANNNPAPAPAADNPAPASSGSTGTMKTVLVVAAIGCGVLLLFAALGTFLYISATRAGKDDPPKRRRKRVYHDEDD